ncbi:histidine kinase [Streptomycetaceae bacterium NBC_01309]
MSRTISFSRTRVALVAAPLVPLAVGAVPIPFRTDVSNTNVALVLVVAVVGLAVSQLAARARTLKILAITNADYLARIQGTARAARSATSPDAVAAHVRDELVTVLGLRGCRFEYGSLVGRPPRVERDGNVVVGRKTWGVDALGWPGEDVELRVFHNGRFYGRFMMQPTPGIVPPLQARLLAVSLADQTGAAFDLPSTHAAA